VISQKDQAVRLAEWERPKQHGFNERENGGSGADAKS
jgi:hypothetical protein